MEEVFVGYLVTKIWRYPILSSICTQFRHISVRQLTAATVSLIRSNTRQRGA